MIGHFSNIDPVRWQIDLHTFHRHLVYPETLTQIDPVSRFGNLDRISQLAVQFAHSGLQLPHLANHRHWLRLVPPANQAVA